MIKLYNQDCFEFFKTVEDNSIDLIVTDPPYFHNTSRSGGGNTKMATSEMYKKSGKMLKEFSNFTPEMCVNMLNESNRILKIMNGYFFCNDRLLGTYCHWADEHKYLVNVLTWNKPLSILNRNRYSTNCEYIVYIHAQSGTALNKLDFETNPEYKDYYSRNRFFPQIKGKDKLHEMQKPYDLIKGYVILSSKKGDTVLDIFMGSGVVGKVCSELSRNFIGVEIDKDYFDIARKNIYE